MVRSSDVDANFSDIVAGVLQKDTFVPYLLIICLEYVQKTSMELMKKI